jgi:hypothetical protein
MAEVHIRKYLIKYGGRMENGSLWDNCLRLRKLRESDGKR